MASHGYIMPVLQDVHYGMSMEYGVSGVPMTFFIDRDGIIRYIQWGAYSNIFQIQHDLDFVR